jgi:glycosyltransferase involved in cell wall biosynthesis
VKVLIIIPAYNEEKNIEKVVDELKCHDFDYDYIIVNDGSTDKTREICQARGFNAIHLPINLGVGGGIQTGYKYAYENGYDIAIQMDGDGQHDPGFIPSLLEPVRAGFADYVIGSRYLEKKGFQSTRLRRQGIKLLSSIIYLFGKLRVEDATSGFRVVNRELIRLFSQNYAQDYPEPEAIIQAAARGYRIIELPVIMRERRAGESFVNQWSALYYIIKVTMSIAVLGAGE